VTKGHHRGPRSKEEVIAGCILMLGLILTIVHTIWLSLLTYFAL